MRKAESVESFLRLQQEEEWTVVDVRAPREYDEGHIPGAMNIPLFDDDERAEVGTLYKQKGREPAFLRGLELVGPKLADFVRIAHQVSPSGKLLVHCWRGGMRSGSLATLWSQAGMEVITLEGGYKAYRQYIREYANRPLKMIVIGGMTGSGKTDVLKELVEMGEQIIDLEGLAHHKGSAFGAINEVDQPTNEQFENNLFDILRQLDRKKPVWIEDESRMIGRIFVTDPIWKQLNVAPVAVMEVPKEFRARRLAIDYANGNKEEVMEAIQKISKRMDGPVVKEAVQAVEEDNPEKVADLLLDYYDRYYTRSLTKKTPDRIWNFPLNHGNAKKAAAEILEKRSDLLRFYDEL